ncbi:1866_t:CDS:2 [Acaulospora morrowiae]|uniref:1866_t:CDS:1 n=1 Tax=Acaulospora morrowiae TaxID=94023 RepID=A0A9N8YS59_9GLOM|nr:1866_t:CDS:2 [Acaulospora morrowiae]
MSTSQESRNQGRRNQGRFNPEEDAKLLAYVGDHGARRWSKVAAHVETRDAKQCRERYFGHLAPDVNKEPFTSEEQVKIYELVKKGCKWNDIARQLGNGRIPNNVKNLWNQKLAKSPMGMITKKTIDKSSNIKSRVKTGSPQISLEDKNNVDAQLTSVNCYKFPEKKLDTINAFEDRSIITTPVNIQLPHFKEFFEQAKERHLKAPQSSTISPERSHFDVKTLGRFPLI